MNKHHFAPLLGLLALNANSQQKPNVIFVLMDDDLKLRRVTIRTGTGSPGISPSHAIKF